MDLHGLATTEPSMLSVVARQELWDAMAMYFNPESSSSNLRR
jgi:hypothetical protein